MRITQAAAMVTKVAKDQWATLIALNDEEGGPNGVRITIVNEDELNQPTPSRAAKCALEVINGLNLENLVAEKLPVLHEAGAEPVEEEVTQEFRDHLLPLNFDAGRYRIDMGPQRQVRLSGAFIDHTHDKVFLWTLSPGNDLLPSMVTEAAKLGAEMLKGLGLRDIDHGQHLINGPDGAHGGGRHGPRSHSPVNPPRPAPEIVEAILEGRQPKGLRLAELLGNGPMAWEEQRSRLGF